jgi:hypothetical protein
MGAPANVEFIPVGKIEGVSSRMLPATVPGAPEREPELTPSTARGADKTSAIEFTLPNGTRLSVDASVNEKALARALRAMKGLPGSAWCLGRRSTLPAARLICAIMQSPGLCGVPLDGGFQLRGSLKADRPAGLYLDRVAGTRVHALAGLCFLHRKGTKAWQGKTAGLFEFPHDGFDQVFSDTFCSNAGYLGRVPYYIRNESLRHDLNNSLSVVSVTGRSSNISVRNRSNRGKPRADASMLLRPSASTAASPSTFLSFSTIQIA